MDKRKKLALSWADFRNGDANSLIKGPEGIKVTQKMNFESVKRRRDGTVQFPDFDQFRPTETPLEVIKAGAFGGCYYRPIESHMAGKKLKDMHKEFPFFEKVDSKLLNNDCYDVGINKYKVKCGGSLRMWESKGWISSADPYGWFQWYCRFYAGRRCTDDLRQINRWERCAGKKGRWKKNLITKIQKRNGEVDDFTISPVVRQTLLHWGYVLSQEDFLADAA